MARVAPGPRVRGSATRCARAARGARCALFAALCAVLVVSSGAASSAEEAAIGPETAAPLGSFENPVRCDMPSGEREYLMRLRCIDGGTPEIGDRASFGKGPDDHIVDGVELRCADGTKQKIFMDMYHRGQREMEAVPGFAITAQVPARAAVGCPPEVPGTIPGKYVFEALEVDFPARPPLGALQVQSPDLEGDVRVKLVVLPSGKVDRRSIEVIGSEGDELRGRALAILGRLQFQAAEHHHGCRVPQTMQLIVDFVRP